MSPRCSYLPVLLVACEVASIPLPEPRSQQLALQASPDAPPGTKPRMEQHFADSVRIKDAVIAGKLADLRAPALRLRERSEDDPAAWRPFIDANVRRADELLVAKDLNAAAVAAAGLARTCGDCHATSLGPVFPARVAPAITTRDPRQRMRRHQWAADRLWEAMVAHSDSAWQAGADALNDPALARADYPSEVEIEDDPIVVEHQLAALGKRAASARDWDDRLLVYGGFLATCAACHEQGR